MCVHAYDREVSEHVKSKSDKLCEKHYVFDYLQSQTKVLPDTCLLGDESTEDYIRANPLNGVILLSLPI